MEQESLEEHCRFSNREEAFRAVLRRATTASIFLASSLIVFHLLPFYPPAMAIFLGIIVGAIAYRWPAVALSIMLFFLAPAYSYQLGGIVWALVAVFAIAVALPLSLSTLPGAAVGCAVGTAAGVLMLTPYFFLALPLLAGITLLRLNGSFSGGAWGLFLFVLVYMPFLFMGEPSVAQGQTIPLFTSVEYARQPSLNQLDLESLKAAFQGLMSNDISGFPSFSVYFVRGWGGIVLLLTMFLAIVATPAVLNLQKRMQGAREVLRGLAPLLTLLAIETVFLVPMILLEKPLGYHTGFASWSDIGILTGPMLALGCVAFVAETWLHRRSLKVELRGDLAALSRELSELLGSCRKRLDEVASVCRNRDFGDEKATISQCEEKVALTVETAGALGLSRLEASRDEFWTMRSQLSDLQLQLETGLYTHLDESRLSYKAIVDEALALGISNLSDVIQTLPPSSEELVYESALVEQQRLNGAFQDLAVKLVSAGDMLASTIKDEFDPEFSLTTIDIGHGFLNQGRFEEAARTISEDLQIIDGRIESSIVELGDRVMAMTGNFNEVVSSSVVPVFESIGDADTLARCKSTVDELEAIARSVQGSKTLADMISIVAQSRKLADLAANMLTELRQKITAFEADNNRRSPAKYNWRNNGHTAGDVHELVGSIESMSSEPIVGSRFSVIETAVQAIGQQARVIKRYSQVNEFLMNYPNVEYMIQQRLKANKSLDSSELPVKPKYALEYLKMYAAENSDDVTFDPKTGILKNSAARRTPRNGNPK